MTERSEQQIAEWAERQLTDYDARTPGSLFAEGLTLSVQEGYALQTAVTALRIARGERVVGYKVGCTSPTIRRQLGIDHCVSGRLFASEQHSGHVTLSRDQFANPAIEGELAIELLRTPNAADFETGTIPPCVARVFPVIELHHRVFRGSEPSAGELIAHNAINGGFVAGPGMRPEHVEPTEFSEAGLRIFIGGVLVDEYSGPALVETICTSLSWLDGVVHERGDELIPGQIILTGSIPGLHSITEPCDIHVDASLFGTVQMTFSS